jgi:hypothetical protein
MSQWILQFVNVEWIEGAKVGTNGGLFWAWQWTFSGSMLFMIMSMGWDYTSELLPPAGLFFIPQIYEYGDPRLSDAERETDELREKPVSVSLCPSQIAHGLPRARTRASALRGRQLTAWATAPNSGYIKARTVLSRWATDIVSVAWS